METGQLQLHLACLRSSGEEVTPLQLTRAEWSTFIRGELLHPTLAKWLGERARHAASSDTDKFDAPACFRRANAALERAEAAAKRWPRRFAKSSDRVTWAVLALLYPDIDQQAAVVTLLDKAAAPEEPAETLDELSSELSVICQKAHL